MSQPPPSRSPRRTTPLDPARRLVFTYDGVPVEAAEGETIAVALLAAGHAVLRTTPRRAEPRGLFCNMGVCFECLVEVDGHANLRACQTLVRAGSDVRTQRGFGYRDLAPELGE